MKFFILIVSFYLVSTQISAQKFSPNQKMSANENKGLQKNLYNAFVGIGHSTSTVVFYTNEN